MPHARVASGLLAGALISTFLAPAARCLPASARVGEATGALEDDVDAGLFPRDLAGSRSALIFTVSPLMTRLLSLTSTVAREAAVHRVVLEQVPEGLGVGEIVDECQVEGLWAQSECANETATDATKTINANSYFCHRNCLSFGAIARTGRRPYSMGKGLGRRGQGSFAL